MNINVACLSREGEHIGPHPDFDGQPHGACRLTERLTVWIGDLHVILRSGSVEPDRRVRIVHDGASLSEYRIADVCSVVAVARGVSGGRPRSLPQTPIADRAFGQHNAAVIDRSPERSLQAGQA